MLCRPVLLTLVVAAVARAEDPRAVEFFEKKVRPLLVEHCLECHGAEGKKVKGGLRLSNRAELLAGGDSGPAVVPGDPAKSRLIQAVHQVEELKMPPRGRLTAAAIADLERWVKDGAVWPGGGAKPEQAAGPAAAEDRQALWAFAPIQDPPVPVIRNPQSAIRNPIDPFIREKLAERDLTPAPPADRYTLLRRVTFDLTGLPPTPAEVEAFVNDASPDAYAKVVARLLASPAYGERWGRHWLDVARYADSNGLDENTAFGNAWRYRDYVIRSFNADKPYDEFLKEQIAGDLMPDAGTNADRLTATAFLVLGPKLLAEPDKQKMKMDIADEQLDTLGKAVLGLTIGCARCHDHKFDPLPQTDYFSLLSVFTSTRTMKNLATVARAFERPLPSGEPAEATAARARRIADADAAIMKATEALRAKVLADARARVADYLLATADAKGRAGVARMAGGAKVPGAVVREAEGYTKGSADKTDQGYGDGIGIILSFAPTNTRAEYSISVPKAGEYDLEFRYAALETRPVRVSVGGKVVLPKAAADTTGGWNPEHQAWRPVGKLTLEAGKNVIAVEAVGLLPHIDKIAVLPPDPMGSAEPGGRPSAGTLAEVSQKRKLFLEFVTGWGDYLRALEPDDPVFGPWLAVVDLPDAGFAAAAGPRLAKFNTPAAVVDGPPPASLGELARRYAKFLTGNKLLDAPFELRTALPANPEALYPTDVARLGELNAALVAVQKTAPPTVMVLSVEDGAKYPEVKGDGRPRNLFVQVRGNYLTPGPEAPPVFPRALNGGAFAVATGEAPAAEPNQTRYGRARPASGRLELAEWIASRKNPLTARVIVNRVWQHHFGEGIVRTPDNFGRLGDRPSHPALLDWLASRFVEDGWSLKKLHQRILMSETYQQAARGPGAADVENRWLSHFRRRRLEAEPVRDALLAVAGDLDRTAGGTLLNNGNFTYVNNENSTNTARYDNHRRSVYLPVIRNSVFDFFQVFDFAEPHVPNGKRASTVVAPQALFLMNSPFVLAQAATFAESLLTAPGEDADRVKAAYLRAYSRPATDAEVARALEYVATYESALAPTEADAAKRRAKAWQSFCQVLFAGSEFIYLN
ncbi:MAG TPA: DUF1553 domain-containing protein [Gemmataceae bacterium]|nr:DUF1553 domain-containing protein [Gemmataceae bacterium]